MAERISKEMIEELRARCDVVAVIGSYIELKRSAGTYKALCPFHKERTPSFHVHTARQTYKCFGCGAAGDVFQFVMEYEGVDFPTALRLLAERVNFRLQFEAGPAKPRQGPPKDVLYKTMDQAAALYHRVLNEHPSAAAARAYLARRQLDAETVQSFRLGYAPDIRDGMLKWGRQAGIQEDVLLGCGLIGRTEAGACYDRFRDRLMFPITDAMGRTIGFSGRILDDQAQAAKYLNSPETALFYKSRVFYALDKARPGIVDAGVAIICEGQIDAIRCHAAGIRNVVASQGTALTESHAELIKRFAGEVVLVLDADPAGQNAAVRSAEAFIAAGLIVRIAALPTGEDPDSLILGRGRDALLDLVGSARSVVDFQIDLLEAAGEAATPSGRQRVIRSVLETIRGIPSAVEQDRLLRQLAQRYFVAEHLLREDLKRLRGRRTAVEAPPVQRAAHPAAEQTLIELMAESAEVVDLVKTYLPPEDFSDPDCRRIAEALAGRDPDDLTWDLMDVLRESDVGDECRRLAAAIQMTPPKLQGDEATPETAARDVILHLRRKAVERQRIDLRRQAEGASGPEQERLIMACQQLSVDLNQLKQGWEAALPVLELHDGL